MDFSDLVERASRGDASALTRLYALHASDVRGVVARRFPARLRPRMDTEDLVQSTFREAFRDIGSLRSRDPVGVRNWMRIKAENKVRAALRRHLGAGGRRATVRANTDVAEGLVDPHPGAATRLDRGAATDRLHAALDRLPDDQALVVRLRDIEGLSYAEIAGRLGLASPDAARMRHVRALIALRRRW